MADFVKALEAEIEKLESELSGDSRFVRYRELIRVRDLYRSPTESNMTKTVGGSRSTRSASGRRQSPERAKALDAARIYLANRSGPTTTRDIYEHLEKIGMGLPGNNPQNNLSAMLSNSDVFLSHGRAGWTLANEQGPPPAPPPPESEDEYGNNNPFDDDYEPPAKRAVPDDENPF